MPITVTLNSPLTLSQLQTLQTRVYVHPHLTVKLGNVRDKPLAKSLYFTTTTGELKQIVFSKENAFSDYTSIQTNLTPFEFQDVLHSLYSELPDEKDFPDLLQIFHNALKGTRLEIRELGEVDKLYRQAIRLGIRNKNDENITLARQYYFNSSYVKNQQELPDLRVFDDPEEVGLALGFSNVIKGETPEFKEIFLPEYRKQHECYLGSFPPEMLANHVKRLKESLETHDPTNQICLERAAQENIARLKTYDINLNHKNVLEVGFGTGVNLKAMKEAFPQIKLFGVEPKEGDFSTTKHALANSGITTELKNITVQNTPETWRHFFDVIVIPLYSIPASQRKATWDAISQLIKPNGKVVVGCLDRNFADRRYVEDNPFSIIPIMEETFTVTTDGKYEPTHMNHYSFVCERPTRLQCYTIPNTESAQKVIKELGGIIESVDERTAKVLFHPEQLVAARRSELGIDRKGLTRYSPKQIAFLQKEIPDAVIEPAPGKKDQQWITYIPTEHNNQVLKDAQNLEKIEAARTIQKCWRGHVGRNKFREIKDNRNQQWSSFIDTLELSRNHHY